MKEFDAFLLGLILGDSTTVTRPTAPKGPKPVKNIALQDVVFCQCLRNLIDELDVYVKTTHPSPEAFIRHLLPKETFSPPFSKKELDEINSNNRVVQEYVDWIEKKTVRRPQSGKRTWESLSIFERIWEDEAHTPDPDHLDLLFGIGFSPKTVKLNGRVYEYHAGFPLNEMATGFFDTAPARSIRRICIDCSEEIVKKYGYDFDYNRFEYNKYFDGKGDDWKRNARIEAYKLLLKDMPKFCRGTWSDDTKVIKDMAEYKKSLPTQAPLTPEETQRRKDEALKIYDKLSYAEYKKFSVDSVKADRSFYFLVTLIVSTLAVVLLCFYLSDHVPPKFHDPILLVGAFFAIGALFIFLHRFYPGLFSKKRKSVNQKVYDYLLVLQDAYYNHTNEQNARKYKEFLDRLNQPSKS